MKPRAVFAVVLCTAISFAAVTAAAPVGRHVSRTIARSHLERIGAADHVLARQTVVVGNAPVLARIYALLPAGYVVAAADDDLPPVIAYALESDDPAEAPGDNPLLRMLSADLSSRLAARDRVDAAARDRIRAEWDELREGAPDPTRFEQWPPAGTTPTGGYLEANWSQGSPWNDLCPIDRAGGGGRCVAGCPAVAMGMILDHLESTGDTVFDVGDRYWHTFSGNAYWIPDEAEAFEFPTFAELNAHLSILNDHWDDGTPVTGTDMAALVFACGVAATQVYSASVSGTYGVGQAQDAYLRFGFADCRLLIDEPDLFLSLADEMKAGHPAHLAVVDPGWTMGHNVVVDGYNSDDYYHLNFGWGGSYNGWYRLPEEIPYGLTVIEGVILDIAPEATPVHGDAAPPALVLHANHPNPFNPSTALTLDLPRDGRVSLRVYDLTGRLVRDLSPAGVLTAGRRVFRWDGRDADGRALPSGSYLCRAVGAGGSGKIRMTLLR